jgi:hypothetical protein
MKDRTGGVDDANETGPALSGYSRFNSTQDVIVVGYDTLAASDFTAQLIENFTAFLGDIPAVVTRQQNPTSGMIEKTVNRWEFAEKICGRFHERKSGLHKAGAISTLRRHEMWLNSKAQGSF